MIRHAQRSRSGSRRLFIFTILTWCYSILAPDSLHAQYLNDTINFPAANRVAPPTLRESYGIANLQGERVQTAPLDYYVNANCLARGVLVANSTRLDDFAGTTFLPSAVPAMGQPFHGLGWRSRIQADGSVLGLKAGLMPDDDYQLHVATQLMFSNTALSLSDGDTRGNVVFRQIVGHFNRWTMGAMDTAFSDPSAVPETIDVAGPNARISAIAPGDGVGQARVSYDFLSDRPDGLKLVTSVESGTPLINVDTVASESVISRFPDLVNSLQYAVGEVNDHGDFIEDWHLQLASMVRTLGYETPSSLARNTTGYGLAFSGAYRFSLTDSIEERDRVMFSIAFGEGISHYVVDLNGAPNTFDAIKADAAGSLVACPVLAWYAAYCHNWSDNWRSTLTYSSVSLDTSALYDTSVIPYRSGEFVGTNLIFHRKFGTNEQGNPVRTLFSGVEYLYGQKELFDGSRGEAHHIALVLAISN